MINDFDKHPVVYGSLNSATFNNCVFHDNSDDGIYVHSKSTIHLHGEATAIHSNGDAGYNKTNHCFQ